MIRSWSTWPHWWDGEELTSFKKETCDDAQDPQSRGPGNGVARMDLVSLRADGLQDPRTRLAVGPERSDGRHQPGHSRRDESRSGGDSGRQSHPDVVSADGWSAALRDPVQQDDLDRDHPRARRGARGESADLLGGHVAQPEPRGDAPRWPRPHRTQGLLLQPDSDG